MVLIDRFSSVSYTHLDVYKRQSKARLETLVSKGNKSARGVLKQLEEPEKFLSTIQIGITLIGIVSGAFGGVAIADDVTPLFAMIPGLEAYARNLAMITTVAVITYLSLIVGELVPKSIALSNPERYATMFSPITVSYTHLGTTTPPDKRYRYRQSQS